MITKILLGLGIIIGILLVAYIGIQVIGFIYITANNLFSSSWVLENDHENRIDYGVKGLFILVLSAVVLIICFMIGSTIIH